MLGKTGGKRLKVIFLKHKKMKNFVIGSLLLVLLFSCKTEKKSNKNLDLFTEEFLESKSLNELDVLNKITSNKYINFDFIII